LKESLILYSTNKVAVDVASAWRNVIAPAPPQWYKCCQPRNRTCTTQGVPVMTIITQSLNKTVNYCLLALLALTLPMTAQSAHHEDGDGELRAAAISIAAEIVDIDLQTREVSLRAPDGEVVTMTSPENVVKLEDMKVGDMVVATYLTALEGELREPTEEELAEPWLEIEEAGVSGEGEQPAIGGARMIRAVCTIEGMNRELGTVTIKDSRGKLHLIGGVEPEKMDGVTLGQTIVMVYAQAMAITLERQPAAAQ